MNNFKIAFLKFLSILLKIILLLLIFNFPLKDSFDKIGPNKNPSK